MTLAGLDRRRFLKEYWQQRPLLIRQALPGFRCPLSAEELAGLALEPDVESRIVSGSVDAGWTLRHGPFENRDFTTAAERGWTLLVQDVEKHLPDLAWVIDAFDQVPAWRVDDLMISYAAPGGSVGPHIDAYDVFLLQGAGRRRWFIDERTAGRRAEHVTAGLRLLEGFEPTREWVLSPGDALYLPPGIPHHGVALDECLTCSVGFRAPALGDILAEVAEELESAGAPEPLLGDPRRREPDHPLEIDPETLARARQQVRRLLQSDRLLDQALARTLSRAKPGFLELDGSGEERTTPLPPGTRLTRNPALRCSLLPPSGESPGRLYLNGEPVILAPSCYPLARTLSAERHTLVADLEPCLGRPEQQSLLQWLLDSGYWYTGERNAIE